MYPHRMRLHGPWELRSASHLRRGSAPEETIRVPGTWSGGLPASDRGIRLLRKFGRPSRLDPWERVWVCIQASPMPDVCVLNGELLSGNAQCPTGEFEVTDRLTDRNELALQFSPNQGMLRAIETVALEIRRTAYLVEMTLQELPDGSFEIAGEVSGASDEDLFVEVHTSKGWGVSLPALFGQPFRCPMKREVIAEAAIKVRLRSATQTWYQWHQPPG